MVAKDKTFIMRFQKPLSTDYADFIDLTLFHLHYLRNLWTGFFLDFWISDAANGAKNATTPQNPKTTSQAAATNLP
jgi:hypothetical protein